MIEPFTIPASTHIGFAHLQVADLQRSMAFYNRLLGFRQMPSNSQSHTTDSVDLSATGSPPLILRLTAKTGAIRKPHGTTGLYHIAIRLPSRAALGHTFRRIVEYQWPIQGAADHLVSEAIYMADPDGNGLELYVDRTRAEWPRQGEQIVMATDPLDLRGLLAVSDSDGGPTDGIHPLTDIGHMHIQVSDLEVAEKFYSGILGLQVMQRSYPGALFLAAGGYHHHLGVNIWGVRPGSHPPADAVGMLAFSLVIPDPSGRQKLLERVQASGLPAEPVAEELLLHDPDGNRVIIS